MDLFCKIYASSVLSRNDMTGLLESITTPLLSIDYSLCINEDFNETKQIEFPDGFLFFPYYLEIEPAIINLDEEEIKRYFEQISTLSICLWSENISAITACDFEELLTNNGGYKSLQVPFPIKE